MRVRLSLFRLVAWLILASAAFSAGAQLPSGKPVRIVVPFAVGGVQDILARSIGAELGQALGHSMIVENRPGAGGTVGTGSVAKSAPDGTTMILSAASHTINASLYPKLSYDPIADFAPVAHIGSASSALIVSAQVPAKTVAEFIRYAKSNPGKLNYASAGNGSANHLAMAYFCALSGIDVVHVPLKGQGDAINEVITGRVQAFIAANVVAVPLAGDARVRLIGVTATSPSKFLPGVPAIFEDGLPGYEFASWFGLLAPAGTPQAIVEQVNQAMAKLLRDPVILERLAKLGIDPRAMSTEEFSKLLRSDLEKMSRVVKASGARIE